MLSKPLMSGSISGSCLGIYCAHAIHAFPFHKAGIIAGDGSGFGKPAIADDEKGVGGEQGGDDLLVGLQLVECRLHIGVFIGGVFEFDHHQRQAIDEQDDIGAFVACPSMTVN